MKAKVNISAEAHAAILRHASEEFVQTGVRKPDGSPSNP